MLNRAQLKKDQDASKKSKKLKKPKDVIVDPRGQWAYPGEVTRILSGDITMQGVPYPVTGIDNLGNSQLMLPGGSYKFPGNTVTEYPHMNYGGTPYRGQIYDRLGRLHSIKSYVPFARTGGSLSPAKAREILHDGTVHGKPITDKQRRYFGYISNLKNGGNMSYNNFKGRKGPFPQIQSEAEFFSRGYHNIDSPYDHGSFQFGGHPFSTQPTDDQFFSFGQGASPYMAYELGGGFGEGHPFSTQPTMKEISSYGRPNWPNFIAQLGGSNETSDNNTYKSTMDAMGVSPMSGANYRWPVVPGVYGTNFAPQRDMVWPPPYSVPTDTTSYDYPEYPGDKPDKKRAGGTSADFNQGPAYFTDKMNNFTDYLRNTATGAVAEDMSMNPMQYFMGGGLDRSEDYGSKKKPYPSVSAGSFAGPHRSYPIPTRADAVDALRLAHLHGASGVIQKVYAKYPELRPKAAGGGSNWIAGAINPAHKGYCTPMSKSTCTPRRKAFARRAKAHFRQEGGAMQEAKWQAILALAEQGVTDPIDIASRLNQEGTYPTTPEEVQGYLEQVQGGDEGYMQEGGQSINPFAMSNISMYSNANQQAQEDADTVGGIGNFLDATANLYQYGGPTQKEFQTWLDDYYKGNPSRSPQYQVAPGYNQPYGSGYGYFPANSSPSIKIKNRNYFNGVPQSQGQPQPNMNPNFPAGFQTPDGRGKIDVNYGRGFLGLGPNRLRSINYEWGNDNSGLPADSQAYINQNPLNRNGKRTTWVGNKLRGLTGNIDKYGTPFPSKSRKEDYNWEEQYKANKANQASNAFGQSLQAPVPTPYGPQEAPVTDQYPIPMIAPEQPTEVPGKSMGELNTEYQKAVEERDRIFKEHNINKRGKHRNILGIQYQDGGPYDYLKPTMNSDLDPENLPGYVPPPTLNDQQVGQIFGEQQDSMSPGTMSSKGKIKFGNQMNGEDLANWGIAGLDLATNIFSQDERRNAEKNLQKQFKAENIFSSRKDRDRGDYTTNYGYFRPDQQSVGNMVTGKFGGQYQEGGEYDLTHEEIQNLRRGGYTIEYI